MLLPMSFAAAVPLHASSASACCLCRHAARLLYARYLISYAISADFLLLCRLMSNLHDAILLR